jgi:hypothetical protein
MSTALIEKREDLAAKNAQLHQVFEEAGEDIDFSKVKCLGSGLDVAAKIAKVQQLNTEVHDLHQGVKAQEEIEGIRSKAQAQWDADNKPAGQIIHPAVEGRRDVEIKSIGQLLVESTEYNTQKNRRQWADPLNLPNVDIRNAVLRTGAGWDPQDIRIPRVELSPQRPIAVVDMIPMLPTGESSVVFMEETTFTNNATEKAESTATTASDLIGEAALALTERSKPVEWLPVFIPVTMQQMEDVEGIEAYVNSRLTYMLRARLDLQILVGDGNTPNLEGTENVSGIQVQAKGADTEEDAIFKAMTLVREDGFAEPSVVFIRPAKFQNIRLRKTADGQYIWGHPSMPGPFTIWGVTMVQTTAVTSTKAVLGDYVNFSALYTKRGITLAVSDSHAFYFTRGMMAIRADMRVAMVHFRPKAMAEVTGL